MAGCSPIIPSKRFPRFFAGLFFVFAFSVFFWFPFPTRGQETADKKQSLQSQIDSLQHEVDAIDSDLQVTRQQTASLSREVTIFNNEIKRRELELKRIVLAIRQADIDIANKTAGIAETEVHMDKSRRVLAENIRQLAAYDQENLLAIVAKHSTLSDFFRAIYSVRTIQDATDTLLENLRSEKRELEKEKEELAEFRADQESLKGLQEVEKRSLELKRAEKDQLLKLTRGKESIFQSLLQAKKRDLTALKTQLFYLEKTGVTAEDAVRYAELAANRVGIRPAFLLALLEVETGKRFEEGVISAGSNLGTGTWRADMSPKQHGAFLQITSALNLDPDAMPVSSRPCSKATRDRIGPGKPCGYGWGGAMGPAQFIPTTWLLFANRVGQITGHNPPSPWNVEDAFTAAATFLADAGASAQTRVGETAAAKTYLSGRPSCSTSACRSYASTILALAEDISRIL